jgi:hypothetical protein
LTNVNNLALTYWNQGRWEEAEKLFVQVIETSRTKFGVDYPDTLTSMNNLASMLWDQGRRKEAVAMSASASATLVATVRNVPMIACAPIL